MNSKEQKGKIISRMIKTASLVITASIALTATACTVRVNDEDGTIDRLIGAAEEMKKTGYTDVIVVEADDTKDEDSSSSTDVKKTSVISDETVTFDPEDYFSSGVIDTGLKNSKEESTDVIIPDSGNATEETAGDIAVVENTEDKVAESEQDSNEKKETEEEITADTTEDIVETDILFDGPDFTETFGYCENGMCLNCDMGDFFVGKGYEQIIISYNGVPFCFDLDTNGFGVYMGRAFLIGHNGRVYLYVNNTIHMDYVNTIVFNVTSDSVKYVGTCVGAAPYAIGDTDLFPVQLSGGYGLMELERFYTVGDDGMPVPVEEEYYFFGYTYDFEMAGAGGYVVNADTGVTDEYVILEEGDYVELEQTDGRSYIEVKSSTGKYVWIPCSEVFENRWQVKSYEYQYNPQDCIFDTVLVLATDYKNN